MRRIWLDDGPVASREYTDHDLVALAAIYRSHSPGARQAQIESNKITIGRDATIVITCPMELRHFPITVSLIDGNLITRCDSCERAGTPSSRIVHRIKWKLAGVNKDISTVKI